MNLCLNAVDAMPIALLGPTASGKSALAVEVARRLGGTVVNGDPFQAMAGLAIGTGQPDEADRAGLPHLGYGLLSLAERPNPIAFGQMVRGWLESVQAEAQVPVLVTGSGLYLKGIWGQLDSLPEVPQALVERVRRWFRILPAPHLYRYLRAVDPQRAAQLHPNDGSRLARALALHLATGLRPSELLTHPVCTVPEGWRALLVLPSRESQRERVARRVRAMAEAGWAEEVSSLVAGGWTEALRELRPLGYLDWMRGGEPEDILQGITKATQAYSRRQVTYFQGQWPDLRVWDPDREGMQAAFARLGLGLELA